MKTEPRIIDYYSLCTADCGEGEHIGQWIACDRCGAATHVKVFEVDHPQHGIIKIGTECFKDVMGYRFGKTHEQALETGGALLDWIKSFDEVSGLPRVIALGLPGPESGAKQVPVNMILTNGSWESGYSWENQLRRARKRPFPRVPHGWSKRIINAGLDLGLWYPRGYYEGGLSKFFKAEYIFDVA